MRLLLRKAHPVHRPVRIKLPTQGIRQMGSGNRSGWPYALSSLADIQDQKKGVLLDDAIERTFQERWRQAPSKEPFVAVFHHPQNMPAWFNEKQTLTALFESSWWHKCRKHLRGAIALSDYLAAHLRERLSVPVMVLKLPTETVPADSQFTWQAFCDNPKPLIAQVGWYLRNYKGIYQLRAPDWLTRVHLRQRMPHIDRAYRNTDELSPWRDRPVYPGVDVVERMCDDVYDYLLARNLVFLDLFDTSANNAIVECIVRHTPVVVNNHPAVREYLGSEYPLCFDTIDDCYAMLNDRGRLWAAHEHLAGMDKSDLTGVAFRDGVMRFVESLSL
ncbi:MAG: hypothetical protein HN341_03275 [Verrucomicrobia bacterium]|jgi:hypothetical protein|nr:hypothetical protein [Verrucomicrobiota bacterium]